MPSIEVLNTQSYEGWWIFASTAGRNATHQMCHSAEQVHALQLQPRGLYLPIGTASGFFPVLEIQQLFAALALAFSKKQNSGFIWAVSQCSGSSAALTCWMEPSARLGLGSCQEQPSLCRTELPAQKQSSKQICSGKKGTFPGKPSLDYGIPPENEKQLGQTLD